MENIRRIYFELSNICNYSYMHKKCPLHDVSERITLPTDIIKKVINEIAHINYVGEFAFHNYNEPLIDPRLFYITEYTKKTRTNAKIRLLTNGFYLTQNLADEISYYGIDTIHISLYSQKEEERLRQIHFKNNIEVLFFDFYTEGLDDRKEIYKREPLNKILPCYSLSTEIIIRHTADVDLCCLDWSMKYVFGNLKNSTLKEVLTKPEVQELVHQLKQGNRQLELCKRCFWQRGI